MVFGSIWPRWADYPNFRLTALTLTLRGRLCSENGSRLLPQRTHWWWRHAPVGPALTFLGSPRGTWGFGWWERQLGRFLEPTEPTHDHD